MLQDLESSQKLQYKGANITCPYYRQLNAPKHLPFKSAATSANATKLGRGAKSRTKIYVREPQWTVVDHNIWVREPPWTVAGHNIWARGQWTEANHNKKLRDPQCTSTWDPIDDTITNCVPRCTDALVTIYRRKSNNEQTRTTIHKYEPQCKGARTIINRCRSTINNTGHNAQLNLLQWTGAVYNVQAQSTIKRRFPPWTGGWTTVNRRGPQWTDAGYIEQAHGPQWTGVSATLNRRGIQWTGVLVWRKKKILTCILCLVAIWPELGITFCRIENLKQFLLRVIPCGGRINAIRTIFGLTDVWKSQICAVAVTCFSM